MQPTLRQIWEERGKKKKIWMENAGWGSNTEDTNLHLSDDEANRTYYYHHSHRCIFFFHLGMVTVIFYYLQYMLHLDIISTLPLEKKNVGV